MCTGADGQVLRTQKKRGASSSSSVCVIKRCLDQSPLHYWWKRMALLAQLSSEHQTDGGKKTSTSIRTDWMPFEHAETPWTKSFFLCALLLSILFFLVYIWSLPQQPRTFFSLAERSGSIDPILYIRAELLLPVEGWGLYVYLVRYAMAKGKENKYQ